MKLDRLTLTWTGAILLVTAGFLFLMTRPQYQRLGGLTEQVRANRAEESLSCQERQAIDSLQREVDQLKARAARLDQQIPKQEMLGTFLEDLARFTEARHLRPDRIEPGKAITSSKVVGLPISFKVHGPFPAIYGLLKDLEQKMPRLTQCERFETRIDPKDPGATAAEVTLRIFFEAS